jgi:KUP system potassium uptake protein
MVITTLLFFVVARTRWSWSLPKTALIVAPLLLVDSAFLGANIPKIPDGGWFPLLVGAVLLVQMATWRRGRQLVAERIRRAERSVVDVLDDCGDVTTVPGAAVFLFKDAGKAPPALINNLRHNKVLHAQTYLLSIDVTDAPHVRGASRRTITTLRPGCHQVTLTLGYLDEIDVPRELARVELDGQPIDIAQATYFVGREAVSQGDLKGMHPAFEHLYTVLHRGADSATRFFNLPRDRVFEVGTQVEL